MGRTLPFTISAFRHFYAKDGPEAKLTIRDVNNFRDICKEGMELKATETRSSGFGSGDMVVYGNETEKIKLMTIEKKYKHVALMSDGHCQSWTDLALLNLGLKRSAPA